MKTEPEDEDDVKDVQEGDEVPKHEDDDSDQKGDVPTWDQPESGTNR